ncbi:MAG: right-handed parallel beta-helix repeat-containing protein, partial [Pirellulaceae bacterium]
MTGDRNVISNNTLAGIVIRGEYAEGNVVDGNYIGTDPDGVAARPNLVGVVVEEGALDTLIGTWSGALGNFSNLVSGNTSHGILIRESDTTHILSNWIGVNVSGVMPLGNGGVGIQAESNSSEISIFQNVVSSNQVGISLMDSSLVLVRGNRVGFGAFG